MVWLLTLHIAALLFWVAALLYLPVLVATTAARQSALVESPRRHDSVARFLFTHAATPAALLAILAGTGVFLLERIVEPWLIVKLTLVAALVIGHVLAGLLVLRLESPGRGAVQPGCTLLGIGLAIVIALTLWTVLAKPAAPWPHFPL